MVRATFWQCPAPDGVAQLVELTADLTVVCILSRIQIPTLSYIFSQTRLENYGTKCYNLYINEKSQDDNPSFLLNTTKRVEAIKSTQGT